MTTSEYAEEIIHPPDPPGPIKWIRENLFSSWFNTLLTIISIAFLYFALTSAVRWLFFDADWRPVVNFPILFAVGQYPRDQAYYQPRCQLCSLDMLQGIQSYPVNTYHGSMHELYRTYLQQECPL